MKLGFSQQEIIATAKSLGLPQDGFVQRRIARAYDLVSTDKVTEVTDGIFRVRSQYEADKAYIVNVNHGAPACDCPDGERTINCKHRIAALLFSQKQAITIIKTTDGEALDYWRRCWLIVQGNSRPMVYEERDRSLFCNCGAHYEDCEHKQLVIKAVTKELKEKRIVTECGSGRAKEIQERLNSQNDNGNGAEKAPSQTMSLDIRDPFQQSEQLDIDQIEGRLNGELVHKLSNGEYVISYRGIMTLAEKHGIEYEVSLHEDTNTVIAKAMNGSERVSGKPIYGLTETAIELAKRNAARQLIPYAEQLALVKKFQLESEFDWQKAKAKCLELVNDANLSIIIHDLTQAGKLRQDNPSHYDRTEWLVIFNACQKDASIACDAGCDASVRRRLLPHDAFHERDPKSLNRWSYNSVVFLEKCHEVINQVRESKKAVEANEMPACDALTRRLPQQTEVKRKLQMDKKLRTWLVEADGIKKEISCREICETFESKTNPRIVTRLRAGIDSGADFSTVELN